MAFSATDWAYRLSDWSGSAQGNKSWSALGTSTRIGEYFTALQKASFYATAIDATYEGHGAGGTTNARNPDPFYVAAYRYDYFYASFYQSPDYAFSPASPGFFFPAFSSNYATFNYYQPQGVYSAVAAYIPASSTFASSTSGTYSSTNYYSSYNVGAVIGITSWSPSTFYNYSPWGAPPYTAGANIFIGAGSSPFSAYPYQYVHT